MARLDNALRTVVSIVVPRDARRGGSDGGTTGLVARIIDGVRVSGPSWMRVKNN
jgi:hypothetical protein